MATRARSLHAAMEEASSSGVKKRLSFTISDDDGANDEKKIRENFCQRNDICNDISSQGMNSVKAIDTRGNHRYRTRRMERTDVYSRKDTLYRRHDLPSADKVKQHRRSSSEQSTPTSHRRAELARQGMGRSRGRGSRSMSPPCASPATTLSNTLGTTLSIQSPLLGRRQYQGEKVVLKKLSVDGCPNYFVDSFEKVQTIRWLGAGISADVFKVKDPLSGEFFAIKKSKQALRNERERDVLAREIMILEKLTLSRHNFDNIVRYYQAWQENEMFYLQMELCEGGTLQDLITMRNRELLPEYCLWNILRDIANGRLKIGDFGMAGNVIESTKIASKADFLEGDAKYIARELLSSTNRLPSADIFCLGIMMLEIATGKKLPEAGKEWHDLRTGHLPTLPCVYSNDIKGIIKQMMHPDPPKRPTAAEILQNSRVQTATEPVTLIQKHAIRQKLFVPSKLRNNTNRSTQKGLLTPHKTRRLLTFNMTT
ncbi:putative protein kinase [Plasmopara halstedii]